MNNYNPKIRAKYTILGAITADSLGSSFEFMKSKNVKLLLKHNNYLKNGLIGAGPFELIPGQFTDDSEMALCIIYCIAKYKTYDQNIVSKKYHEWYLSDPFDMGKTTKNSVSQNSLVNMINASKKYNSESLSNGFLMRLFGLVSMYYDRNINDLIDAVKLDVILTHSHFEAKNIAIIYAIILWKAIQGINSKNIYEWLRNNTKYSELIKSIFNAVDNNEKQFIYNMQTYSLDMVDSEIFGFVGFALWFVFKCLKYHNNYENAIIDVISYGGDTDTNACIVGAIMAALYPNTVPKKWIYNVINCQAKKRYKYFPIADPNIWTKWLP
ncbi:putative ADP-ribosylglycohydrolase [Powai lake megavirus]|uniref:Putative ADP-ribosylglycohydrolase n=1 Tax=Powai lake megavirus TaxID=1842663 RepID=A0A167RJL8_9VIRU|nr:putative ADP-ribosylglycohydrolase [Powai lake megavirus]ANB50762.1 putative ADP-ribosylglycohydrolase [Powai lake megavirus]